RISRGITDEFSATWNAQDFRAACFAGHRPDTPCGIKNKNPKTPRGFAPWNPRTDSFLRTGIFKLRKWSGVGVPFTSRSDGLLVLRWRSGFPRPRIERTPSLHVAFGLGPCQPIPPALCNPPPI